MGVEDLKQLVLKLAVVAQRLDERSENAVLRIEHSANALGTCSAGLHADSDRFARQVLDLIATQAGGALERGIREAVDRCNAGLRATADAAAATSREMDAQVRALSRERHSWVWHGTTALLASAALAVVASTYWSVKSRDEIARNQVEAALLHAYNQADVTLCEDGRLCANVDDDGRRHGDRRQYRVVRARSGG